jgi:HD-like signal output (HDOD) protein
VSSQKLFEFKPRVDTSVDCRVWQSDPTHELPDVPVLSGTLLAMELIVSQGSVDLAQVSQLVLSDLGATLQIFRQAEHENVIGGRRLARVEDCISGLGLDRCFDAMASCLITRSTHSASVYSAWGRAREVAVTAKFVAEKLALDVASEDAYLVGLVHGIGNLPEILKWDWATHFGRHSDLAGLRIAEAWRLPHCVVRYFSDRVAGEPQTQWTTLVDHALELLESPHSASLRDEFIQFPFRSVRQISA